MMFLYRYEACGKTKEDEQEFNYTIRVFDPSIMKGMLIPNEQYKMKSVLVRILFHLITRGKEKIVYVLDKDDRVVHISYVIPKCVKFPFLNRNDYEIGPCVTHLRYRGQGIYSRVLEYICENLGKESTVFYMIVDSKNLPSIRGIEKTGFQQCGIVEKSKFFNIYKSVK